MLRALLWVLPLALCVGLIAPVLQSVIRQRNFYRLHEQTRDKIRSLAVRCPLDVPPDQWQKAVDWTANLIVQVYFSPVQSDPNSLKELHDGLSEKINGAVDLTTLQWVWEHCEEAPRDGAVYAIRFRSIRLLTKEPITDNDLPHLWSLHKCSALDLSSTEVTDAGLKDLEGFTQLAVLNVNDTKITEAGVKRLQESLPHCRIGNYAVLVDW